MTIRRTAAPQLPEQQQATAARQGFGGGQGGRVRNASPVRPRPRGRRQASSGAGDPCDCCRCQRISSGTVIADDLDEYGETTLLTATNCACAFPGEEYSIESKPWIFIDGLLHLSTWWDPGEPDENGDYVCNLRVGDLPGSGPWTWAWLWETSSGCWSAPV